MSEKKINIKKYLLIFFLLLFTLSFVIDYEIQIGKHPGQFFVFEKKNEDLSEMMQGDINPDEAMRKEAKTNVEKTIFVLQQDHPEYDMYQHPDYLQYRYTEEYLKLGVQRTLGSKHLYLFLSKIPFGGKTPLLNYRLWRMIFIVDLIFVLGAFYLKKKLSAIPSKVQIICEMVYQFIADLVVVSLGEKNKVFIPYFMTLFLFIWLSNWVTLIPIPGFVEPTRHLSCTLGLGIMSLTIVHFNSLRKKGIIEYVKGFCEPFVLLMPLNIVGEVAKIISLSFRLFGNIFGGAIITVVVTSLTKGVLVPVALNMFFTMFSGTIQAFVFIMLSLTYLSLEIGD